MLSELSEIKSIILNFDNLEENEILEFSKKIKVKQTLIKSKVNYYMTIILKQIK